MKTIKRHKTIAALPVSGARCLLLFILGVFCSLSALAQTATLKGRIERSSSSDGLSLYVFGNVDETVIDVASNGSFSVDVDLVEPTRCVLYWTGRSEDEWSFVVWLQPDSVSTVALSARKENKVSVPAIKYDGACADLARMTNLFYQSFERQNIFDEEHLKDFADFSECQAHIEKCLQPLGEAWLDVSARLGGSDSDEQSENQDVDGELSDDSPLAALGVNFSAALDSLEALGEFTFATMAEKRGQKMDDDAAFAARLAELDKTDIEHSFAISQMTKWDVVAHPERYAPLTEEAARLRCLMLFTTNEVVRNTVADYIMQEFFFRVQVEDLNPESSKYRSLYEELRRASTSGAFDDFIEYQLGRMDNPEMYRRSLSEEEADDDEDDDD